MAQSPGKDNKKSASKTLNLKKDQEGTGPGSGPVDVVKLQADLDKANEANLKFSEDYTKLEEKKIKAEKYIVELKKDLAHKTELVKALRKELAGSSPDGVATNVTPEEKKEAGAEGTSDGICGLLTCKKPFNVEDGIIRDETSKAYLSTKCPFCDKIQNAENARLRFTERQ